MKGRISKALVFLIASGVAFCAVPSSSLADDARFFRIVGPTATTITAFTPDGYITWTNAQIGTNYTVQTARNLGNATHWVDYIQIPASNNVITNRLYDPNPPSGMALIPAGAFTMGNCMDETEGYPDELPQHTVYVSAFYIDTNLVTKSLWDTVYQWAIAHGYSFVYPSFGEASTYPMTSIDWYDCVKWCNARSEKENKTPAYYTDAGLGVLYRKEQVAPYVSWNSGYRLPTEAEWEKAARGGASGQRFPWGNTISWSQANYDASPASYAYDVNPTSGYNPAWISGGNPYAAPVGSFASNGYGLYDMAGNVWEWCWDWYGAYSSGSQTDPLGPASGSGREIRGGSYYRYAIRCRVADRHPCDPAYGFVDLGFRSVLPVGQP